MAEHLVSEEEAEHGPVEDVPTVPTGARMGVAARPPEAVEPTPEVVLMPQAVVDPVPPPIDLDPVGSPAARALTEPTLIFGDRKSKQRKPVLVELVTVRYWVIPPKMRSAARMFERLQKAEQVDDPSAMFEQIDDIIRRLFRGSAEEVIDRLEDDDDELGEEHITELIKALMSKAAGADPTT